MTTYDNYRRAALGFRSVLDQDLALARDLIDNEQAAAILDRARHAATKAVPDMDLQRVAKGDTYSLGLVTFMQTSMQSLGAMSLLMSPDPEQKRGPKPTRYADAEAMKQLSDELVLWLDALILTKPERFGIVMTLAVTTARQMSFGCEVTQVVADAGGAAWLRDSLTALVGLGIFFDSVDDIRGKYGHAKTMEQREREREDDAGA